MVQVVAETVPHLPSNQPRYLMGVGSPADLVEAVRQGVDMFDCVLPTRNARNGALFTRRGKIVIKNAQYAEDPLPVESGCSCYACQHYSRAYLRHLYLAGEILAMRLNTIHNLHFYLQFMKDMQQAIAGDSLDEFVRDFKSRWEAEDEPVVEKPLASLPLRKKISLERAMSHSRTLYTRVKKQQGGNFDVQ